MNKSMNINGEGYLFNENDIIQSWNIILNTVKGSDPLRQKFGSNLYQFIDKPLTKSRGDIIATVKEDLEHYEPRTTIKKVSVSLTNDGHYQLKIYGVVTSSNKNVKYRDVIASLKPNIQNIYHKGSFDQSYNNDYEA